MQIEKPNLKELTVLHNEASALCQRLLFMEQDYKELVEFSQSQDFKEFSEESQDVMLRSIDKKAARIARLRDDYDNLVILLNQ